MNLLHIDREHPERLSELLPFLLQRGIVKNLHAIPSYNDEPKFCSYYGAYESRKGRLEYSTGFSFFKKEEALAKAAGEALERYSLERYRKKDFIMAPWEKLINSGIDPKKILSVCPIKYSSQIEKAKSDWQFCCVTGYTLGTWQEKLVPAQLVYVPYIKPKFEPWLRLPISTGAASGLSLEKAIYRGICEVIERDAFMIYYLNSLSGTLIDISKTKDSRIKRILEILGRYKLYLALLDITTDLKVPVFLALIIDKTNVGPSLSIGLKAGFVIEESILGAIGEALVSRIWLRNTLDNRKVKKINLQKVVSLEDRAAFWWPMNALERLSFWLGQKTTKKLSDYNINYKGGLKKLLSILNHNHIETIIVDITPNVAKKKNMYVIKAIIPELQPLHLDESLPYVNGRRLYEVPHKLATPGYKDKKNKLNKIPHPFL